jgi:ribulose-5-phosphate 4-epimerase/fuculose-1-phosphate aldolase
MRLKRAHERRRPQQEETDRLEKLVAATTHIDWRNHGLVTRVKNQGKAFIMSTISFNLFLSK